MHWSEQTSFSNTTRNDFKYGHHQIVNIKTRLIIFFAAEDKVLYSHQRQDLEVTVAQIMSFLLQN